jgi:hypothetical protein
VALRSTDKSRRRPKLMYRNFNLFRGEIKVAAKGSLN